MCTLQLGSCTFKDILGMSKLLARSGDLVSYPKLDSSNIQFEDVRNFPMLKWDYRGKPFLLKYDE